MTETLNLVALYAVHLLAFLGVAAAVICRVDEMNSKRNKLSWWCMYVVYVVFAFVALIDVLASKEWSPGYLLGLLALGLNLIITMKDWGPCKTPALSCRPGCGP